MVERALKLVNGLPRMTDVGIDIKNDGSPVMSSATTLNFIGNAAVVDATGGQADISIAGGDVSETIYDETIVGGVGGISASTPITLPNSGEYTDVDLKVFKNGLFLDPSVDYNYIGSDPRTQISLNEDLLEDERLHLRIEGIPGLIYDETIVIGVGGITTGTSLTLPNSGEYDGNNDLKVYLNGELMEEAIDYNIETGSPPFTEIQMTFDLLETERLRFRIDS